MLVAYKEHIPKFKVHMISGASGWSDDIQVNKAWDLMKIVPDGEDVHFNVQLLDGMYEGQGNDTKAD